MGWWGLCLFSEDDRAWVFLWVPCAMRLVCLVKTPKKCIPHSSQHCCSVIRRVWLIVAPWTAALKVPLTSTISWSLLKLMSIELVILSNHLILSLLLLLLLIFLSNRVFPNESAFHIREPKYWSFSFSISPSNEYSGLISFRIDWFDSLYSSTPS